MADSQATASGNNNGKTQPFKYKLEATALASMADARQHS
jgi:hypothetical protein